MMEHELHEVVIVLVPIIKRINQANEDDHVVVQSRDDVEDDVVHEQRHDEQQRDEQRHEIDDMLHETRTLIV